MMKNRVFLLVALAFVMTNVKSQNQNGLLFDIKLSYKLSFIGDSTDIDQVTTEEMILLVNSSQSLFESKNSHLLDSIKFLAKQSPSGYLPTSIDYKIVKNDGKITTYESLLHNRHHDPGPVIFKYEEEEPLDWVLSSDTIRIGSHLCQRADAVLGGRKWIAYFDSAIPLSDGPYKFSGLPGLILRIHDDSEHWNFELTGMENQKNGFQSTIVAFDQAKLVSRQEFFKQKHYHWENFFEIEELKSKMSFPSPEMREQMKSNAKQYLKRISNWIELNP